MTNVDSVAAAELRRQKILQNRQKRLDMLIGVKSAEAEPEPHETQNSNTNNNTGRARIHHQEPDSTSGLVVDEDTINTEFVSPNPDEILFGQKTNSGFTESPSGSLFRFNGYSNAEIVILFSLAFFTCLVFEFGRADLIYENALLPFVTFEMAHLAVYLKYLPTSSSQFQLFRTLLQLCGISQKSLKNLMIAINFIFMLIDNFVIYIFCFLIVHLIVWNVFRDFGFFQF